jgi:hypothetical protein
VVSDQWLVVSFADEWEKTKAGETFVILCIGVSTSKADYAPGCRPVGNDKAFRYRKKALQKKLERLGS